MLIVLEDDILQNENDDAIISAIQNLSDCIRNGRHIVIASRTLLQKLYMLNLSPVDRRCFKTLSQKITQFGNLKNKFNEFIKVSGTVENIENHCDDSNKIFVMPIKLLSDSSNLQATKLICEDLEDCDFYRFLAKYYIKHNNIPCIVDFDNINGGGQNTAINYKDKLLSHDSPCLIITDSDKTSYDDDIGETATKVKRVYEAYCQDKITDMYILNVREKENLIPPKCYCEIADDESMLRHYEILSDIYDRYKDLYLFGDIKSGLKLDNVSVKEYIKTELFKISGDIVSKTELLSQIENIKPYFSENNKLIKAIEEMQERDDQIVILGVRKAFIKLKNDFFEGHITDEILKKKKILDKHKSPSLKAEVELLENKVIQMNALLENIPQELKDSWNNIGKLCVQWGCKLNINFV